MKKTKNTPLVRELIRLGVERGNAYRIMNAPARDIGEAPKAIRIILPELMESREEIARLKAILKDKL